MKLSLPVRAIIILISVLLIVSFYQSKRIMVFADQIKNPVLRSFSLAYANGSESLKSFLRLKSFFSQEAGFWQSLKQLPSLLSYQSEIIAVHEFPALPSKIGPPCRILIVGDSFIAESFGPTLEKYLLGFQETEVFRRGVYPTGFSRPDYFNWETELTKLISEKDPNVAFVMFGANDSQDQKNLEGKTIVHYGDQDWNQEYGQRVASFLQIFKDNNIFVFWIGNPIARDKYYADKMANLNSVYKQVCSQDANCLYLDTWNFLATPEGQYSAYLPDQEGQKRLARSSDGIHTTAFGSQLLLGHLSDTIVSKLELQQ